VIPVRNRFEFLSETISSVFCQTRLPDEVLIVDDGSTIPVESYLAENPPPGLVRILRIDRSRNCGGARNYGWRHAQGDLIVFNDSDDLWEPDKIRLQAEYLESHPEVDGVYGPMEAFFPDGSTQPWAHDRPPVVDLRSALLDANLSLQTLMIRRRALETLGGFDETLPNLSDQAFTIEIGRAGLQVVFLPTPVVTRLRRNNQNMTRNTIQYFICACKIALRYRQVSARVFGPGSVLIHLSRALRHFGTKTYCMGLPTRIVGSVLEFLSPRSRMPRHS
jgi:glycosyltransferase involved in cell wall biosynthesis